MDRKRREGAGVGAGVLAGSGIGIIIGATLDSTALGIGIGIGLGVALATLVGETVDHLRLQPARKALVAIGADEAEPGGRPAPASDLADLPVSPVEAVGAAMATAAVALCLPREIVPAALVAAGAAFTLTRGWRVSTLAFSAFAAGRCA